MTEIAGELEGSMLIEEPQIKVEDLANSLRHFQEKLEEQEEQEDEKEGRQMRRGMGKRGPPKILLKQEHKNVLTAINVKEEVFDEPIPGE